ncbi:cupin domain-containing protein [Aspergillus novofumigatus IBT 16806]|uniref:Cupin 2 conserved barrel domain-containing protein n=1 Tax=Aspergillus novofumigatus (strain IBT 16806) TaxID=1392255 RepID=A0A2I1BTJ1_ASPN1|nr:uncharacterized protein P174DRAFT_446458 [Aspergillus novofumigatus IBT 16806]PKX88621.1 hypothetical protein P174DRAFT_446458 [Aspergillus novofumigatus IBT 16806]
MQEPTYDPSRPKSTLSIVYAYKLVNCPGKTIVGLLSAYVLRGTVLNKMNDDPMKVIEAGGTWYEAPGCHHRISDNASATEPATLMVAMVLDSDVYDRDGVAALIQIDVEYR